MKQVLFSLACLAFTPLTVLSQISDTTSPQLMSRPIAPTAVDVTLVEAVVSLDMRITDDLSGVKTVQAVLRSSGGSQSTPSAFGFRTSGTERDGMYRVNLAVPRFAVSGLWHLDNLVLRDHTGNSVILDTATLQSRGFRTGVSVTSIPDTQPPMLTSLNFTTPAVDVSAGGRNVVFTLGISDDLSGLDLVTSTFPLRIILTSPSGRQTQYLTRLNFKLIAGSLMNGTWEITHLIPAFSEAGVWRISSLILVDFAGNLANLMTADIEGLGLPASFTVLDTNADTAAPQITSLAFTPSVIDTSLGTQPVDVTLGLTDNLAGVDFSPDTPIASFPHGISFGSSSGRQTICCSFPPEFTRASGTARNGIWTTRVFFPQFSETGTWVVSLISIKDSVRNSVSLGFLDLAKLGLPFELTVFRPSQTPDGTIGTSGGTVVDQAFGNRARVTVPANLLSMNTTVAIDVLGTPLPIPVPTGFGMRSLFMSITLAPPPSFPLPAPGLTVTIPLQAFVAPGTSLTLFRFDTVTGGIVPAFSVTGGNVIGTVNGDGLSATFTGVSRLSTLVAFIPDANRVLGDVDGDRTVNCLDMAAVRAAFGKKSGAPGFNAAADVNNDGVIDIRDLTVVSRQLPAGLVCQ